MHAAMPKPWQMIHYDDEFLPYNGIPFEPSLVQNKEALLVFLKWKEIDSGYHQIFNFEKENLVISYRAENDGSKRYSLWLHPKANYISIKKESLGKWGYQSKRMPSYIYIYRVPKMDASIEIQEQ